MYDQHSYRNRICLLTGQRAFDSLLDRARELKAISKIMREMSEEGVADRDVQMQQAWDGWLRTELPDYWPQREALTDVLRYLARTEIDHWRQDAARVVAGAVENDHV